MSTKRNYLIVKHNNYVELRLNKNQYAILKDIELIIKLMLLPCYMLYIMLEVLFNEIENH